MNEESPSHRTGDRVLGNHLWRDFSFCLYRQLAMVEVTASLVTGIELYFLSSSIGDWIERKMGPNWVRLGVALGLAAGVVGYFLIAKHMHPLSAG